MIAGRPFLPHTPAAGDSLQSAAASISASTAPTPAGMP
jgi:hypothetical protein